MDDKVFPYANNTDPALPLVGLKVLDLSRLLPGPHAAMMLGDLGADVLKVEDTSTGDYMRWEGRVFHGENPAFLQLNRNKRSICLNFKDAGGREIFKKLVERADVLLESFRPGVMAKFGLGYENLKEINPGLIYCAISGYGQTGPYSDRPGHDLNYTGYAGLLGISGTPDTPMMSGMQIGDLAGGSLFALVGILAALQGRHATGNGRMVDVSMTAGVTGLLPLQAAAYLATGYKVRREGWTLNGALPEYGIYETADGKFLTLGALEPKFFSRVCELIGLPEYGEVNSKGERRAAIKAALTARFKEKMRDEWLAILAHEDACVGPAYDFDEVFEDEQARHFGVTLDADHATAGKVRQLNLPFRMSNVTPEKVARQPAPAFGEHTAAILEALGYNESQFADFKARGAIK
jgi:alpha-methylacyl-CoA racemase